MVWYGVPGAFCRAPLIAGLYLLWLVSASVVAGAPVCSNGFRNLPLEGVMLDSQGYRLRIHDEGSMRSLFYRNARGHEMLGCRLSMLQPDIPVQPEHRELLASFLLAPVQGHSLVLGMGNIGLIRFLRSFTPAQFIDVTDADPVLISAAETYFSLSAGERLTIRQDNPLDYLLGRPRNSYDVIYLDQHWQDRKGEFNRGLPPSMQDRSVLDAVRERLNASGVMIMVLHGSRKVVEQDIDHVIAAFPHVFAWESPDGSGDGVTMLAALKNRQIVNPLLFRERARKLDQKVNAGFSFTGFIDRMLAGEYRVMEI